MLRSMNGEEKRFREPHETRRNNGTRIERIERIKTDFREIRPDRFNPFDPCPVGFYRTHTSTLPSAYRSLLVLSSDRIPTNT